jgi:hypothetical protein
MIPQPPLCPPPPPLGAVRKDAGWDDTDDSIYKPSSSASDGNWRWQGVITFSFVGDAICFSSTQY